MARNVDILIVDDEEMILMSIEKICKVENYSTDKCSSVADAIQMLKNTVYKLIICDIMMPEEDGFVLLNYVVKNKLSSPVVITSGYSTLANVVKALYQGAVGFLPKPFTIDELLSIVNRGMFFQNIYSWNCCKKNNAIYDYIPCPAKYSRFGYDSWTNRISEGLSVVGLTDLFLKSISNVNSLSLLKSGDKIEQGNICMKVSDENNILHHVLSPLSGSIIETNNKILNNKSLIEKDPYFEGWVYKVIPNNISEESKYLIPCSADL